MSAGVWLGTGACGARSDLGDEFGATGGSATLGGDAPPFEQPTVASPGHASERTDAGEDAGTIDSLDAPADADPLAPCTGSRDVFSVDVQGATGYFGGLGRRTVTDSNSRWFVNLQPELNVFTDVANLTVYPMSGSVGPIKPGTYRSAASNTGGITLALGGRGCVITSWDLTVVDLQYVWPDAGPPGRPGQVTSLALWFDVACNSFAGDNTIRGCVRYSR